MFFRHFLFPDFILTTYFSFETPRTVESKDDSAGKELTSEERKKIAR